MTALIAATESESQRDSRIALIAAGWVMSFQNVAKPVERFQRQNAAPQP